MKKILIMLSLFLPFTVFSEIKINTTDPSVYEKEIFAAAKNSNILGGVPIDKQSFQIKDNNNTVGVFIAGKGFNANDDTVCFVGWVSGKEKTVKLIPTIGYGNWEAETCLNTEAVSLIPYDNRNILAVIYKIGSPNATGYETVIFKINEEHLIVDDELTNRFGSEGIKTIKDLRNLINGKGYVENK
ncbi:hypothetical protein [Mixta intestinalis]|uniref:Uncharacterized protein n=1 Tax=Mixta intestinalis TaxID=1615494 RepID=A0A6P1Q4A0_9GAMM|nr:hypothetical protein [Mixta intestinalis]QHM73900.1 hypothetical protein C7M51_04261 [Mixta intestinalis]